MDKNRINEIKEKIEKATSREELKELFIQLKAEELKYVTDPNEYAMRAAHMEDLRRQQQKEDAMRANEQSEERFRKMMQMGNEKENIERLKNIPKEIIEKKVIIEPLKIKDEVKVNGSGIKIVNPPVEELVIRRETNRKSR